MKSKQFILHLLVMLVLYNAMALGTNQLMETGTGYFWMFLSLGSAFMLGVQFTVIYRQVIK
jgi:hypothetical protein